MSEKPLLYGLVRDDHKTPEGKYLVKRRDGTDDPDTIAEMREGLSA